MKHLRFDSVGGASGDMILGALIDLGVSADEVTAAVSSLSVDSFSIQAEAVSEHGLVGTRVSVNVDEAGVVDIGIGL